MLKNLLIIFLGLVIPVGYTCGVAVTNENFLRSGFTLVDLSWLIFQWQTIFHLAWGFTALLLSVFYVYTVIVKGYWIYALAIPLHLIAFVFMWIFTLLAGGQLMIYDTLDIDTKTYHIVELNSNATGYLYVFECGDALCHVEQIDYIDSSRFFDAGMTYDESSHTLIIWSDDGGEIEEIQYQLE